MNCATETSGLDKVLVDTSVWIEFFRKSDPSFTIVQTLLAEDRVCTIGLILAELMQGSKTEKELEILGEFIHAFEFLPENPSLWRKAGELSFRLRKQGMSIGLADCFIAVAAREGGVALLSLDRHFSLIEKDAKIRLYS